MTVLQALLAFLAAASILTITPGVDTALVLRVAASGRSRPAAFAAMGVGLGCLLWGLAVSVGLGAILAASRPAFTAVRIAGSAYLLWMGFRLIVQPRSGLDGAVPGAPVISSRRSLRQGFLTNILNPKVGVFYITFLPQFVPHGVNVAVFSFILASIHVALGLIWFALLIAATVPMGRLLRRPRVIRTMDRMTGGVFIAFGAKLALTRN